MKIVCVITSINGPTAAMDSWLSSFAVVVAPDTKTPIDLYSNTSFFLTHGAGDYGMHSVPQNHYSRKMLGYLESVRQGAMYILDTDDDTFFDGIASPLEALRARTRQVISSSDFVNIYSLRCSNNLIWPRGLPLTALADTSQYATSPESSAPCAPSVIQFLINGDTDVDAIHRLVFGVQETQFSYGGLDVVPTGYFCPFNSQLTLWDVSTLPLMYLPSTVTFRFTDILRGVVAKRILDAHDLIMGFADPIGYQVRNPHDYLRDFESEIPCYLHTALAWDVVGEAVSPEADLPTNLLEAYEALVSADVCAPEELDRAIEWTRACQGLLAVRTNACAEEATFLDANKAIVADGRD